MTLQESRCELRDPIVFPACSKVVLRTGRQVCGPFGHNGNEEGTANTTTITFFIIELRSFRKCLFTFV